MIDVSALVGDIPTTTITVRTYGAPSINTFGEATATSSDASVTAVVHPTGRRTLERMKLDTKRETISVYTTSAIATTDTVRPPAIQYGGRWYEVTALGDYAALGGIYLVHAQLLDTGAVAP